MTDHPMLKYLKTEAPSGPRLPLILCPGCGAGQVLNYTLNAVDRLVEEEILQRDHVVFLSGVGCSARLTSHYLDFDSGWTIHGRALSIATGALLANPDLRIIVFTGDGDAAAIGGNHLIHTCRRNMDLTIVCINNGLYGMTGGQVSPTTRVGEPTVTTPYGNVEEPFDLCDLARTAGAAYVARWTTAHPVQTIKAIGKGIMKKGTAFIEILSQCPVHEKSSPTDMLDQLKEMTARWREGRPPPENKISVGEFRDVDRSDWISRYQVIIDDFRQEASS